VERLGALRDGQQKKNNNLSSQLPIFRAPTGFIAAPSGYSRRNLLK
jgi:hypothetical protein